MQRYNEPAETTSPRSPRTVNILDSPSGSPRTPPRRSILRQPTIGADSPPRRGDLRQPTLLDSPSGSEEQLLAVSRSIRDFIRENISFDTLEHRVLALSGHQDLKDMLPDNMDYVPQLRRLADMLELIENKRNALESVYDLVPVGSAQAVAPTEDSGIVYDSDDEPVVEGSGPYDPFAPIAEVSEIEPLTESESSEDDYAGLMDSDEDRVTDVSATLRF